MNFAVGWAAANSPKEIPPGVHTYTKALRDQLNKHNDKILITYNEIRCSNRVLSASFLDLLYLQTLATAWAGVFAFQRWTVPSG